MIRKLLLSSCVLASVVVAQTTMAAVPSRSEVGYSHREAPAVPNRTEAGHSHREAPATPDRTEAGYSHRESKAAPTRAAPAPRPQTPKKVAAEKKLQKL